MLYAISLEAASSNYNKWSYSVELKVSSCYKIDKITTASSIRHFWKAAFPSCKFVPSSLIKEGLETLWAKFCSDPAISLNIRTTRQSRTSALSTADLSPKSPAAEEKPRVRLPGNPKDKWEYLNLDGSETTKTISFSDSARYIYVLWLRSDRGFRGVTPIKL